MIGWMDVQRVKRVEEVANKMGFMLAAGSYTWGNDSPSNPIYLKPLDDMLPQYSRDAEIFSGSLEEIDRFLLGITWARQYDEILKVSNPTLRERKEQDYRNKHLLDTIKESNTPKLKKGN